MNKEQEQKMRRLEADLNIKVSRVQTELELQSAMRQDVEGSAEALRSDVEKLREQVVVLEHALDASLQERDALQVCSSAVCVCVCVWLYCGCMFSVFSMTCARSFFRYSQVESMRQYAQGVFRCTCLCFLCASRRARTGVVMKIRSIEKEGEAEGGRLCARTCFYVCCETGSCLVSRILNDGSLPYL
jgi:hypothetical protein